MVNLYCDQTDCIYNNNLPAPCTPKCTANDVVISTNTSYYLTGHPVCSTYEESVEVEE